MGSLNHTLTEQRAAVIEAERHVKALKEIVESVAKKVDSARRNGYATLREHELTLDTQREELDAAKASLEQKKMERDAAESALRAVQDTRRAERIAEATEAVNIPSHIALTVNWNAFERSSRWELQAVLTNDDGSWVMEEGIGRDGTPWSEPKRRFGFQATVYGPCQRWGGEWKQAEINWGSLSSQGVDAFRDLLALYTLAADLAAYLNEQAISWYEQDLAD